MKKFSIPRRPPTLPRAVQHFLANPRLRVNLRRLQEACTIYPQVFAVWAGRLVALEQQGRHAEARRLWSLVLQRYRGAPALDRRPLHHLLGRGDLAAVPCYVHALLKRVGAPD